jgi:hypothetical protein
MNRRRLLTTSFALGAIPALAEARRRRDELECAHVGQLGEVVGGAESPVREDGDPHLACRALLDERLEALSIGVLHAALDFLDREAPDGVRFRVWGAGDGDRHQDYAHRGASAPTPR